MKERTIFVTEEDMQRLNDLVESAERISSRDLQHLRMLKEELAQAEIVTSDEIPADVVTMNSTARVVDVDAGEEHELTLAYPRDADGDPRKVSVFAPVGSAILGLRVGQAIQWPMPGGRERTLRIEAIRYQPEASGHLHR